MSTQSEQLAEHWNAMIRSAMSVLGSRDEAEECAGQALLQACETEVDDVLNLQAFMVTIAKRRAIDRVRHLDRARRRDQIVAAQERLDVADVAEDVTSRAEATWMAAKAHELLDFRSFDVLRRYADGEPMPSIAASHALSEGAARTVLHRARKYLREIHAGLALGLGWLAGRRLATPVTPTLVTTALVSLAVASVPMHSSAPRELLGQPVFSTLQHRSGEAAPSRQDSPSAPAYASVAPIRGHREAPERVAVASLPTRLGGRTEVSRERRGDPRTQDDPVSIVLDCLANFEVSPSHVGC